MMFWMTLYGILDMNTDCQNEKVPPETYPLTNFVFYLPNSRKITCSFDHPSMKTEETYSFCTYILQNKYRKILFTMQIAVLELPISDITDLIQIQCRLCFNILVQYTPQAIHRIGNGNFRFKWYVISLNVYPYG